MDGEQEQKVTALGIKSQHKIYIKFIVYEQVANHNIKPQGHTLKLQQFPRNFIQRTMKCNRVAFNTHNGYFIWLLCSCAKHYASTPVHKDVQQFGSAIGVFKALGFILVQNRIKLALEILLKDMILVKYKEGLRLLIQMTMNNS